MTKTTAEKIAVMQAYENGDEIEARVFKFKENAWFSLNNLTPAWDWSTQDYRVKPKPAPIPMTIPWDVIEDKWQWAAMNQNGGVYVYPDKPQIDWENPYWSQEDDWYRVDEVLKIDKGTVDWKDSLQERHKK